MWFLIFALISILGFIVYKIWDAVSKNIYKDYIFKYSNLIKNIKLVNSKYIFKDIKRYTYNHSYDNEIYYNSVSPKDFLTYQLIFNRKEVLDNIKLVKENVTMYQEYEKEYKSIEKYGVYNTDIVLKNKEKLLKIEKNMYEL